MASSALSALQQPQSNLYAIYIINKAGGLIYQKDFIDRANRLTSNNHLQIAGVFHGMYAITSQLAPTKETSSGIRSLESDCMRLRCYQSVTGTKFIVTAATSQNELVLDNFLSQLYQLYADYVLKNPFYDLEQPIHNCHKFQLNLDLLVAEIFNGPK